MTQERGFAGEIEVADLKIGGYPGLSGQPVASPSCVEQRTFSSRARQMGKRRRWGDRKRERVPIHGCWTDPMEGVRKNAGRLQKQGEPAR